MYTLDLICINGHDFEGWFENRTGFEKQKRGRLIVCPICGDTSLKQRLSAVRIKRHAEKALAPAEETLKTTPPASTARKNVYQYIQKNFEDVGHKFADEAIKIHSGEAEKRNIRGTATADEEKVLAEEGISFFKLPNFQ